jgi:hypothetical protein
MIHDGHRDVRAVEPVENAEGKASKDLAADNLTQEEAGPWSCHYEAKGSFGLFDERQTKSRLPFLVVSDGLEVFLSR